MSDDINSLLCPCSLETFLHPTHTKKNATPPPSTNQHQQHFWWGLLFVLNDANNVHCTGPAIRCKAINKISTATLFDYKTQHFRSAAYIKMGQFSKAYQDAVKAKELNGEWPKVRFT